MNPGKSVALLIGINYRNTNNELRGCINDVNNIEKLLLEKFHYKKENIVKLTEDEELKPTKENIMKYLSEFVVGTVKNDINSIFLHYSGHGSYVKDKDGDENDGKDEVLVPLDYKNGFIRDDTLNSLLKLIPENKKVFALFDCCHSGTMFDLKYNHRFANRRFSVERNAIDLKSNIIAISGSKDSQTSADAFLKGEYAGAMTTSFIQTLEKHDYNISYFDLLDKMREYLDSKNFKQVPQLTTSQNLKKNDFLVKPLNETHFFTF